MISLLRSGYLFCTVLCFIACEEEMLQQPSYEYVTGNSAETGARYPNLYQDENGVVYMSWMMQIEEDMYALQYATYEEGAWSDPVSIRVGTNFFVNWADFPSVVSYEGSILAAHWLRKISGGTYAYNVNITFPGEQPRRWADPVTPHSDGTPTEHGFVSMEPIDGESVLAIWLDGRNTDGREHGDYEDMTQAMTIRSAEISTSGEVIRERVIDSTVCDCCQTALARLDDGFAAVYRNRTGNEIRDIYFSRYRSETGEWSEPVAVSDDGWEIMACPVNGPRIVADGETITVAWYTMANDEPRVLLAESTDGGETFSDPLQIAGEYSIGRVDLAISDSGTRYVSWMEQQGTRGYVMMRELSGEGQLSDPVEVGLTSSSRSSGFPRIKLTDRGLLFAWTQTEPVHRIRTARVPVEE